MFPPKILCHLTTGHFCPVARARRVPSTPRCLLNAPSLPKPSAPSGAGEQTELPWHSHVATAGPHRLVQHLEAHGAVEGRDGHLGVPSALQGPRGGRGGRGFAAIAAQHGAHGCASHADSCQELSASRRLFCRPAVEEGSPGPAAIAASQRAQRTQPAAPNPGLEPARCAPARLKPPSACCGAGGAEAGAAAARCALRSLLVSRGLKPETSTAEPSARLSGEPSRLWRTTTVSRVSS